MKCSECFCYVKRPTTDGAETGWCYLNPPTILVAHDHWCSHHNLKNPLVELVPKCTISSKVAREAYEET